MFGFMGGLTDSMVRATARVAEKVEDKAFHRLIKDSGGNFRLSPTDSADTNTARLSRAQYEQYKAQYRPVENQLLGGINPSWYLPIRSSRRAAAGFDVTNQSAARMRARYGARGLADISRLDKLAKAAMVSQAGYNTAKQARDVSLDRLGKTVALGKGLSSQSGDALMTAAQNESSRKQAAAQMKAQRQAAEQQTIANVGMGLLLGFASGIL